MEQVAADEKHGDAAGKRAKKKMNLLDDAPPSPSFSLCSSTSSQASATSLLSSSSIGSVGCPERLSACAFDGEIFCFDAAIYQGQFAPRCRVVAEYLKVRYSVSFTSDKAKASYFITDAERATKHNAKEQKRHVREFLNRWTQDTQNPGISDPSMLSPIVASSINSPTSAGTKMFVHATTASSGAPLSPASPISLLSSFSSPQQGPSHSSSNQFASELRAFLDKKLRPLYVSIEALLQFLFNNLPPVAHSQFRAVPDGSLIRAEKIMQPLKQSQIDAYLLKKSLKREREIFIIESDSSDVMEVQPPEPAAQVAPAPAPAPVQTVPVAAAVAPSASVLTIADAPSMPSKPTGPFISINGEHKVFKSQKAVPKLGTERTRLLEHSTPFYNQILHERYHLLKQQPSRSAASSSTSQSQSRLIYCEICGAQVEEYHGKTHHLDSQQHAMRMTKLQSRFTKLDTLFDNLRDPGGAQGVVRIGPSLQSSPVVLAPMPSPLLRSQPTPNEVSSTSTAPLSSQSSQERDLQSKPPKRIRTS